MSTHFHRTIMYRFTNLILRRVTNLSLTSLPIFKVLDGFWNILTLCQVGHYQPPHCCKSTLSHIFKNMRGNGVCNCNCIICPRLWYHKVIGRGVARFQCCAIVDLAADINIKRVLLFGWCSKFSGISFNSSSLGSKLKQTSIISAIILIIVSQNEFTNGHSSQQCK